MPAEHLDNPPTSHDIQRADAGQRDMTRDAHQRTLWAQFINLTLGVWLMASPVTLGYTERAMIWNDLIAGALVIVFSAMSLSYRRRWAQWANVAVGLWLLFAPLVFWTTSAAAYANDTLIGAFVIGFAVLVAEMPGMSMQAMMTGPDMPRGWSYTPSTWIQRLPIIALAFFGFFIARYLTAFQLGHIPAVWDPFFKDGTARVITSDVSKMWPIPDAGLGAVSYMIEALSGLMGDKRRWRTMPWMVALFGIMVVPLGVVSIVFIIIQPIVIGTWCTLCLIAAAAMVIMIPYSLDEIIAMVQFMRQNQKNGKPFWRTFWQGGTLPEDNPDRVPGLDAPLRTTMREIWLGGVNYPWTLVAATAIGVWLMFTRVIFGTEGAMANSDHLVGSLVVTFTVMAMAEVARPVRFINFAFGAWLIVAPWILSGASSAAAWGSVVAGLLLIALSIPRGKVTQRYGGWNRYIV